jgi:hypothetical protein
MVTAAEAVKGHVPCGGPPGFVQGYHTTFSLRFFLTGEAQPMYSSYGGQGNAYSGRSGGGRQGTDF